jgi:hypothetical protein
MPRAGIYKQQSRGARGLRCCSVITASVASLVRDFIVDCNKRLTLRRSGKTSHISMGVGADAQARA